jgi:hypothetical protein
MSFSTGLKIKAAEALALGIPVVAHKHAFEGLRAEHRYHRLETHEELAMALVDLAFSPERLDDLRAASRRAAQDLTQTFFSALDETRDFVRKTNRGTLCVESLAGMSVGSFAFDCMVSRLRFLSRRSPILIWLEGKAEPSLLQQFVQKLPSCRIALPAAHDRDPAGSMPLGNVFEAESLSDLMDDFRFSEVVLGVLPEGLDLAFRPAVGQLFLLADAMAGDGAVELSSLPARCSKGFGSVRTFVVSTFSGRTVSQLAAALPNATQIRCPPFWIRDFRPLKDCQNRPPIGDGALCVIAERVDARVENLCRVLAANFAPRAIRVIGTAARAPLSVAANIGVGAYDFYDIRRSDSVLPLAAAASAIISLCPNGCGETAGLLLALRLLGRRIIEVAHVSGTSASWLLDVGDALEASSDADAQTRLREMTSVNIDSGWAMIRSLRIGGAGAEP